MKKKLSIIVFIIILFSHVSIAQSNTTNETSILEEVVLGNAKQWIQISATDLNNPILLFLHGGPGYTSIPFSHADSELLKEHFIVVHWDQLGAGKSYHKGINPMDMTVERFLNDTHELIQLLKKRFGKEKIFLIGHSWGSCLGLYTAMNHPEDLYAYIGMGQAIDLLQGEIDGYNYTMQKAVEFNDTAAIRTLQEIGMPPFKEGMRSLMKQRMYLGKFGGAFKNISYPEIEKIRKSSPYYTEVDQNSFMQGYGFSYHCLWNQVMKVNFFNERTDLKVPVYFFEGRYDFGTPFALVEKYVEIIDAPHKEIIWFENSGHFINLEETQKYQEQLIKIASEVKKN